jgi:alpha-galactosidase
MEGLVLEGDLYRIDDPFGGNFFSVMLVSKDKSCAHMTVYRRLGGANPPIHRVKAKGLDEKKKYYVPELGMILGGDVLMSVGIVPKMSRQGDFRTVTYHFEEK